MSAELEITELIDTWILRLREKSFKEVAALPETIEENVLLHGKQCGLTTYVQKLGSGDLLVTVQFASPILFGLGSQHRERGLVFSPSNRVREATSQELHDIE